MGTMNDVEIYGEGADEVYSTVTQVEDRVAELLGVSTVAAR